MHPGLVIPVLWLSFLVSWVAASGWSSTPQRMANPAQAGVYRLLIVLGGIVLGIPSRNTGDALRLYHVGLRGAWLCTAALALGFAFTWWARIYLGRLWSASITLKPDHKVIDSGPYGLVRHPMYTGAFLSILATAAVKGTIVGFAGAAMIIAGFWLKAHVEERWLSDELGEEAYSAYRRKVPMLIPFLPAQ